MRGIAFVGAAVACVAACGGDDDGDGTGAPSPVGTWREVMTPQIGVQPEGHYTVRTFGADGSYSEDPDGPARAEPVFTGTYQIGDGRLVYPAADGTSVNTDFARTDDNHLLFGVMRPVGVVDGLVGIWTGSIAYRNGDQRWVDDLRLDLRADGSATYRAMWVLSPGAAPETLDLLGTWEPNDETRIDFYAGQFAARFMFTPEVIAQRAMIEIGGP